MNLTTAILSVLEADRGHIHGRTLLQKKIYFLGVLAKDLPEFGPYLYGPYSRSLSNSLDALVGAGIIQEQEVLVAQGPLADVRRQDYRWGSPEIESALTTELLSKDRDAQRFAGLLARVNGHAVASSVRLLSAAAKVHFILARVGSLTVSGIQRSAGELGWDLTAHEIASVIEYLKHLDLVKVSSAHT